MKRLIIPMILCLAACQQTKTASPNDSIQAPVPDSLIFTPPVAQAENIFSDTVFTTGDFNGDGTIDTAYSTLYEQAAGEDWQARYRVRFFSRALPDMPDIFGRTRLVNEGDLDGDGRDELSTFNEPLHGCIYNLNVWSFINGSWEPFAGPLLVPTSCDAVSDKDLEARIWKENDTVFIWEMDLNDENSVLIKKPLGFTSDGRLPGMAAPTALREAHSQK
ncbi:hypothetical protein ACFOTA_20110 [Chitinophaga sp. GCM10012297]|uniref:Lipoprotein n=1 Tax=Chitinophaga chungangae TaxID=2821488 RepID=A0ABS3YIK9_9BACT|nr:hypothetical protein [Chitinophaga chungangae]MBO9154528.1 hypothetical protein [Chitinophaga chungangae]